MYAFRKKINFVSLIYIYIILMDIVMLLANWRWKLVSNWSAI